MGFQIFQQFMDARCCDGDFGHRWKKAAGISEGRGVSVLELMKAEQNVLFSTDALAAASDTVQVDHDVQEMVFQRDHFLHT